MPTIEEIETLEKEAELNDGHCSHCTQTIKIYRYSVNKAAATFMRALATQVRDTGVNDVDISTIGLPYSVRSQVSKIRQHALIARVKDRRGIQLPSRWLVTSKGWAFVNGKQIPARVIVFNNQVLGHDDGLVTIYSILGEMFDPKMPIYEETPVSAPEARTYADVRQTKRHMVVTAKFKNRDYLGRFKAGQHYELEIKALATGQPIEIVKIDGEPSERSYRDIAAFQREWKVV